MENKEETIGAVKSITKVTKYYQINFSTGEEARLYVLNDHVFRYYVSPKGIFLDYPEPMNPEHEARIVYKHEDAYGLQAFKESTLKDDDSRYIIETKDVKIIFHKTLGTMEVHDLRRGKEVFSELRPLSFKNCHSMQTLRQRRDEYFFGGGMQNGRFTHKGEVIEIVNTNKWNDGDVASPCPFYWSSSGYGALRNTFRPGEYDFGKKSMSYIETTHNGVDFDAFYFINELPRDILNDYYELTGKPILLPEYAYYEAHLNAFNRDYWVKVTSDINGAILFEDGQYYKCYEPNQIGDKTGILESLNGEVTAYTLESQYQYMWGPNILVAPIYSGEKLGKDSLRDGIYLPDSNQIWIDFLTGEKYQGGKIYNNIVFPLWKIPVFVKDGAIIPTTNPNNNPYEIKRDLRVFTVYPNGTSSFIVYEDDGITSDYLKGSYATTKIHASGPVSNKNGDLIIKIHKTKGHYKNIVKERRTLIQVMCSRAVGRIKVSANEKSIRLKKVRNSDEFANNDDCFYHDENFQFNPYLKNYAETKQKFLLIKLSKLDVTACEIIIKIKDVSNKSAVNGKIDVDNGIEVPKNVKEVEHGISTIGLQWDNSNYDYNEVEKDGVIYTNIKNNSFIFNHADGVHECRVRSIVGVKASKWSEKVILNNQNVL